MRSAIEKFKTPPQVAKRMQKNGFVVNVGKEIPYVMCKRQEGLSDEEAKASVIQEPNSTAGCAFHPKELANPDYKIELDQDWYVKSQLQPLL